MQQLEMARGHDGLLRGMPEPAVLLALYCVDGDVAQLAARYLYRFARPPEFPCKVGPQESSDEVCTVAHRDTVAFVLLALAVEEDSGRGLQSLYAAVEDVSTVMAWSDASSTPAPMHLTELAAGGVPREETQRVNLLLAERDPSTELAGDDWVDAGLLVTPGPPSGGVFRMHFRAADGRNDWTAQFELSLRRA
jgi:hypothetical protein